MELNMNVGDRLIRFFLAVVFISLGVSGVVSGLLATILYVLAAIFVLTGIFRVCLVYKLFGLNTNNE